MLGLHVYIDKRVNPEIRNPCAFFTSP